MKLTFEEDYKYYYYYMSLKKDDFCCDDFYNTIHVFKLSEGEEKSAYEPLTFYDYMLNIGLKYPMKIRYCPYCGEKIEFKK